MKSLFKITQKTSFAIGIITILSHNIFAEDTINIGMSTALSGPAQKLGKEMHIGISSYFNKINETGGIQGKKLKLIALDDGYEPKRTAPNVRELIEKENVLAIIGNVGTPTAIAAVPIINENKTLLFGALTGAGILRKNPPDRYVINYRASYAQETAEMINALLKVGIKPEEIAFFTQNDGYGDAGFNGAIKALKQHTNIDESQIVHGRYERNTLNVENALVTIMESAVEPKAIIMVGAYAPCAKFIDLAKEDFPNAYFLNVSFVGSRALSNALDKSFAKVIVTQVVPHYESDLKGVDEYRKDLVHFSPSSKPGFISLEGYLVAKVFVEGLKSIPPKELNKESIINAIEQLKEHDIGINVHISYSKTSHQASNTVWPTILKKGKFVPFQWSELRN